MTIMISKYFIMSPLHLHSELQAHI